MNAHFESISYLNRFVGFVGAVLNLLSLIVMSNKSLIHHIYTFFWCRQFCSLIVCVLACGWVNTLEFDVPNTYNYQFYSHTIISVPFRLALTSSSISDVILILKRYFIITDKKVFLLNMSKLTNLTICFLFPICMYTPCFFMYEIQPTTNKDEFVMKLTNFGISPVFQVYLGTISLICICISVFALGVFNTLSVIFFREKMKRKGHLLKNKTATRRAEVAHTKMVIILTTICFVTRLIDTVVGISVMFMVLKILDFSADVESRIRILYEWSCLMIVSAHALDVLVYIVMDSNLRRCTEDLFRRITRRKFVSSIVQTENNKNNLIIRKYFRKKALA